MKLGFIGLGKMGSRMVMKLLEEGHEIVVWNRSPQPIEDLRSKILNLKSTSKNLKISGSIEELITILQPPRTVWVMVTAGRATQVVLNEVSKFFEKSDIVIDGGNAHFRNTQRRFEEFGKRGIRFLGIGVSGGIIAFKQGYPLMVGGNKSAYDHVRPILDSLAKPNGGHEYFGVGGAGHFVKMVHNGIEYGIMQSLGEGFGVLEKSPYKLDLLKVAKLWQKGTLVLGFMLDRVVDVLSKDAILSSIEGYIEESGEARWTVEEAKRQGVPIEIIEQSLEFRRRSHKDSSVQHSFAARLVSALRSVFGGHEVRKKMDGISRANA